MKRKNIIFVILAGLFLLLVVGMKIQEDTKIIAGSDGQSTVPTNGEGSLTKFSIPDITIASTPSPVSPTLGENSVSGMIAYWDIRQSSLRIISGSGDDKFSISYDPEVGIVPHFSSPIQWSPDGRMVAFGCLDSINQEVSGVCILDLVENLTNGNGKSLSTGLTMIQLPRGYIQDGIRSRITSLEWTSDGRYVILTPFCLISITDSETNCSSQHFLDLPPAERLLLEDANYIAPSPVENEIWAIAVKDQLYIGNFMRGEFKLLNVEKPESYNAIAWSSDGEEIALLYYGDVGPQQILSVVSKDGLNYRKLLSSDDLKNMIDPNLVITKDSPFVIGYYNLFARLLPRQNLSWASNNRYIVLNIYYHLPNIDEIYFDAAGLFYLDIETGELIPIRVDFKHFKQFASPDWYACSNVEKTSCISMP